MGLLVKDRIEDISFEEWDDVLARSVRPSPFLSRRFLVPWVKTFAAGRPLRIARWERGGRAEGFMFLCRRAESEGWELLGSDRVSDSLDAVVAAGMEGEFWAELLRSPPEMLAEGPLHLPSVVEGSPSLSLLPGICGERGIAFFAEEADRSPFLRLPESFDDYLGQLDKKERHELRRKLRRAGEAEPRLSFRVTGTAEELSRDFPSFLELHRRSHPEKRRFMDDRMAGFDPEAGGRMSPGMVLLARCVEDAIGRGLKEYDFLRGRERYKYDLGGQDRIVYRATLSFP